MTNNLKEISFKKRLKRRYFFEQIFKLFGILGTSIAVLMLFVLIYSVSMKGYKAFYAYYLKLDIVFDEKFFLNEENGLENATINFDAIDYENLILQNLLATLKQQGINASVDDLEFFTSVKESFRLQKLATEQKENIIGKTLSLELLLSSDVEMYLKKYVEAGNIVSEEKAKIIDYLLNKEFIVKKFNKEFFTNADSRNPELAGIKGAFLGSVYTALLTIIFSVIIGIGAAIYLEEFAKKNNFIKLLELNINNLAAVPSIIFGLLGLVVFQQFFGIPRSTPLLASFILTLMALPTIIITSRVAISNVPITIKEAAYSLGSSQVQVITKHLLPISLPGILTGVIIAISRIIGETAPLLMIGMVAFVNSVPSSFTDAAIVFPVQILLWADSPELGYIEKASAAIMLLLLFLIFINGIAIYLRNKFEIKF